MKKISVLFIFGFIFCTDVFANCAFNTLPSVGNCTIIQWTDVNTAGGATSPGITPQCSVNYPNTVCSQVILCPAQGKDFCYQRVIAGIGVSQTMQSPVVCPSGYILSTDKNGLKDACITKKISTSEVIDKKLEKSAN